MTQKSWDLLGYWRIQKLPTNIIYFIKKKHCNVSQGYPVKKIYITKPFFNDLWGLNSYHEKSASLLHSRYLRKGWLLDKKLTFDDLWDHTSSMKKLHLFLMLVLIYI